MQHRSMGNSDLTVSAIGFGCWEMGGTYGAFDDSEVIAAIHRAIDLGVTLFDTALIYGFTFNLDQPSGAGNSEVLLARARGERPKDVQVVTKGGQPTRTGQPTRRDSPTRG